MLEIIIRSLTNILESLFSEIPNDLLSETWCQKLSHLAENFPSDISQGIIFESLLNSSEAKTDLTFRIEKNKLYELSQKSTYAPYNDLFLHPDWLSLRKLFKYLSEDNLANQFTDFIWLEFDISENMPEIPRPLTYVYITDDFYQDQKLNFGWVDPLLSILTEESISEQTRENIHFCYEQLFSNMKLDYFGYMPNRQKDLFRLCVSGLNPEEACEYLSRLGMEYLLNDFESMLKDFPAYFDCFRLHLDVGKSILPKVGLEHYFCKRFDDQEKWLPALDYLENHYPVVKSKTQSLRHFWKKYRTILIQEFFNYTTFRFVHHVKLVYEKDKDPLIKGYFGYANLPN